MHGYQQELYRLRIRRNVLQEFIGTHQESCDTNRVVRLHVGVDDMSQMTIFDTPDTKPKHKTGFLNRWHVRRNNKHVALAIPGEHTVHIYPGKYQNVIE